MSGNVWEWTNDWFIQDLGSQAVVDPLGGSPGINKVMKGGDWNMEPVGLRAAMRWPSIPDEVYGTPNEGFRCVRSLLLP